MLHLGPSGVNFLVPIIIHLPYNKKEGTPVVMTRSNDSGEWEALDSSAIISQTDTEITFETSHFSMFAVTESSDDSRSKTGSSGGGGCFISSVFE